jgi:membrane protease YdiL (CAAX protease family)
MEMKVQPRSGGVAALLTQHPVLTYYALVFAISWGLSLIALGPAAFVGVAPISNSQMPFVYAAIVGPLVAGVVTTLLISGRLGLRDLRTRLFRWNVGIRWYAVALLTAPVLTMALLLALSLASPAFTPVIFTARHKAPLLVTGIAIGLVVPFFEETGWTGFVIPQLRQRRGIIGTGVIVGLLWGLWHLPMFSSSASSSTLVPPALYLAVLLFSWLVPYRVLMVWVYDRTKSLLLAMAMHLVIDFNVVVLIPHGPEVALTFDLVFAAALWLLVGVVVRRRASVE